MHAAVRKEVGDRLSSSVQSIEALAGGCICDAYACSLADGRKVFVKTKSDAPPTMFQSEARGLEWLAKANALETPAVLAVSEHFLALEFVEAATRAKDFDERLGRGLALLHQTGASQLGDQEDGFLATLPQSNRTCESWPQFYAQRRVEPLIRRAVDHALVPKNWAHHFEPLLATMKEKMGSEQEASRLHGDLWSGNVHTGSQGQPVLIDPAAYGGHREVDLAMLSLFGNPSQAFYDAYQEVWPLEHGHASRVQLYQLYPLLAHVNLFGGSYIADCERIAVQYR